MNAHYDDQRDHESDRTNHGRLCAERDEACGERPSLASVLRDLVGRLKAIQVDSRYLPPLAGIIRSVESIATGVADRRYHECVEVSMVGERVEGLARPIDAVATLKIREARSEFEALVEVLSTHGLEVVIRKAT